MKTTEILSSNNGFTVYRAYREDNGTDIPVIICCHDSVFGFLISCKLLPAREKTPETTETIESMHDWYNMWCILNRHDTCSINELREDLISVGYVVEYSAKENSDVVYAEKTFVIDELDEEFIDDEEA